MKKGKIRIIIDPLYGDSGKGKIASLYSFKDNVKNCVEFGTGHSACHVINTLDGTYYSNTVPPVFVNNNCRLLIDSSIHINETKILKEMEYLSKFDVKARVGIDKNCRLLEEDLFEYKDGTTIREIQESNLLAEFLTDVKDEIGCSLVKGENQLIVVQHGSKVTYGYGEGELLPLPCSINEVLNSYKEFLDYIHVTFVLKLMPTRSLDGPLANEIPWPAGKQRTVGRISGKQHRISSCIDSKFLRELSTIDIPFNIALSFADYYDSNVAGITDKNSISDKIRREIDRIESITGHQIECVSTGEFLHDYFLLK